MSTFLPDLEPWQRLLGFSLGAALFAWSAIAALWHLYRQRRPKAQDEIPLWQAVRIMAKAIGEPDDQRCFPETLRVIRQSAEQGRIHIRGKRELEAPSPRGYPSEIWTEIEPAYWRTHKLNSMATGEYWERHDHSYGEPLNIHAQDRYWSLRVLRSEIEKEALRCKKMLTAASTAS